jgi:uncharacterized membrane protein
MGGLSVVVIGGLLYWFMNKSDIEEKVQPITAQDLIPDTSDLIEVRRNL